MNAFNMHSVFHVSQTPGLSTSSYGVNSCLQLLVYGCFLSKLQSTVRSFYGIDGSEFSDCWNAWCCPCQVMFANEQEILLRQKQRNAAKGRHYHDHFPTSSGGYYSQAPMSYLGPDASKAVSRSKDAVHRKPEAHQLSTDTLASANIVAYPQVHYLDQHWYLVPINKGSDAIKAQDAKQLWPTIAKIVGKHSLNEHELVVTGSTRSHHELESDVKTHHSGHSSSHQLHQDATTPVRTPGCESPHQLCCDPVADETKTAAAAVVYHDLPADKTTHYANFDNYHGLDKDMRTGTGACAVPKHDIHAHGLVDTHGTGPPHHLKDDKATASSSKLWTGHALGTDAIVASNSARNVKHGLDAHKGTEVGSKRTASHELHKD